MPKYDVVNGKYSPAVDTWYTGKWILAYKYRYSKNKSWNVMLFLFVFVLIYMLFRYLS